MLMVLRLPAMATGMGAEDTMERRASPEAARAYFERINRAMDAGGHGKVDTGSPKKCFDFMFAQFGNCEFQAPVEMRVMSWREDFYKAYAAYKKPHNAQNAINACNVLAAYFPGTMQQQDRIENDFNCNRCGAKAMLYFLYGACLYKLAYTMPEGVEKETKLQKADELQTAACDEWVKNTERGGFDETPTLAKFRVFMRMVNAQ